MDKETSEIYNEQKVLQQLVGHEGWSIVRRKFRERQALMKDAFEVDDTDEKAMLLDLKIRKAVHQLLEEILQDIEGTASQAVDTKAIDDKSYIVRG